MSVTHLTPPAEPGVKVRFVCENCNGSLSGSGRYYPGSNVAHQPKMERVCERCEQILMDAAGRALQAKYAALDLAPALEPMPAITAFRSKIVARAEKARTLARILFDGGVPATEVVRMTAADWKRFHEGLTIRRVLRPGSTVPSDQTIAQVLAELLRLEAVPAITVKVRRRVA